MPDQTALQQITEATKASSAAIGQRNQAMRDARASGATWAVIAAAAGMTPNGVRKALGVKRDPQ